MSVNITDSSTFTTPIVAPADGDAATAASVLVGLQGLANRTKYLSDQLLSAQARQFARFAVSGTSVVGGGSLSLTETFDPLTGYSVASSKVTLPAVGYYLVCVSLNLSGDTVTSGTLVSASCLVNVSTIFSLGWRRYSTTIAETCPVSGSAIVYCSNTGTDTVELISNSSGLNVGSNSVLSISRLL